MNDATGSVSQVVAAMARHGATVMLAVVLLAAIALAGLLILSAGVVAGLQPPPPEPVIVAPLRWITS